MITRKELEDVLTQMNAIFERVERRLEKLEEAAKKPAGRPKKTT
jgi:hypothetical protein